MIDQTLRGMAALIVTGLAAWWLGGNVLGLLPCLAAASVVWLVGKALAEVD